MAGTMAGKFGRVCYVFVSLLVSLTYCQASISSISPCKDNDEKCVISKAETLYPIIMAGDPSIGTEPLDPVWIDKIEANLSIIKLELTNVSVYGYADCKIKHLKIDSKQSSLNISLSCPEIKLTGDYDMNGRLIVLPVEGNGNCTIFVYSYNINIDTKYKVLQTDDGKEYMSIKSFKFNADSEKGAFYQFDNLFHGRKDLSDTVHKFANENSIEVLNLFQDTLLSVTFNKFIKNVNTFLKTIPMKHLFI